MQTGMPKKPFLSPFDYPHHLIESHGNYFCSVCLHLNYNCTCIAKKSKDNMWLMGKFWIKSTGKTDYPWQVIGPRDTNVYCTTFEFALTYLRERIAGLRYRKMRDIQGLP